MITADLLTWWYGAGWLGLVHGAATRIQAVMDFFSVSLLLGTLFDPFREIDAGSVNGSPQEQLRAFGNRLFSRIIGFFIRTVTIICSLISAMVVTLIGLAQLILWPLIPLAPLFGLVAAIAGWKL